MPALFIALLGTFAITVSVMIPSVPEAMFLVGIGLVLLSVLVVMSRTFVNIQVRNRRVTKITRVLLWSWTRHYPFSCFSAVTVRSKRQTGPTGATERVHRVLLIGKPSLLLPGGEVNASFSHRVAAELADTMHLQLQGVRRPKGTKKRAPNRRGPQRTRRAA